ncbi:hypothetical protein CR513_59143, partial [Mucuna pruriens]
MTIQLSKRSVVQPLGILEDVLGQVNDLIFPTDFYVLDMEDEASRKGFSLILGRPFLMIAKMKIEVYVGMLSMEFGDNLHPTEHHSLFGIDMIDKLVEEHTQLDPCSDEMPSFVEIINVLDCAASVVRAVESIEMSEVPNLKPLPSHLKYDYLDDHQQFPVIIANNLHQEQEEKLLQVLRDHKKAIGWKLSDLPRISPSIFMHRILLEEEARLIKQQQQRLNPTILDVMKEVTKLLAARIIYPISDIVTGSVRYK